MAKRIFDAYTLNQLVDHANNAFERLITCDQGRIAGTTSDEVFELALRRSREMDQIILAGLAETLVMDDVDEEEEPDGEPDL